jgi:hypothetical protein
MNISQQIVKMVDSNTGDSPQSVPSLAETSFASSQEGDDVTRALFVNDESKPFPKEVVENIQKISEDHVERQVYGTDISITSSETTAIATWNLSPENASDDLVNDGRFPVVVQEPSILGDREHTTNTNNRQSPIIIEVPPEESPSCNGALSLTPRQLAEIFLAFEGARSFWPLRQNKSGENGTETPASSPPTKKEETPQSISSPLREDGWMPRAETLKKECTELKKIMQDDSSKLLNLKRAMEAQRELNALKEIEIEDGQLELEISEDRLEALRREKEVFRERESELVETIRILKEEVDKLTRYKCMGGAVQCQNKMDESSLLDQDEGQNLRREIQLFSSQIVEQEIDIAELRTAIEGKDKENQALKSEVEYFRRNQERLQEEKNPESTVEEKTASKGHPSEMGVMIENISKRLEVVEREKYQTESLFIEELKKKDNEIHEIRNILKRETLKISQDPDEIEVLLNREKATKALPPKAPKTNCCCDTTTCGAWDAISGDLY